MLVCCIGDFHLMGRSPTKRIDDLPETQFIKWQEIVDLANGKDCPIISVGDIFHTSVVANSIVNRLGSILNNLKNPLYFVFGNHDLMYHSIDLASRTSLGVLLTNHPKVKHISEFENVYGISWDYMDWDSELVKNDSSLFLCHKSVVSHKQMESNFWIANDETFAMPLGKWSKDYKLVICGHWHKPYSFRKNKTNVINAGPVSRITIEDNLNPSVCLINLKTGIFKRHYLKSAKPFDDVFNTNHINKKTDHSKNIEDFINALNKKGNKHDSVFMDELMSLINTHELNAEMEVLLLDILAKVKEKENK
jgi:predicted phosphodiesterase